MTLPKILVLSIAFLATCACTRQAAPTKDSTLKLNLSSSAQVLTAEVAHIVINVRGPGMPQPIIWNWDGNHCSTDICPPAPTAIEMNVPSGSDRLIQVLVVKEDETAGTMGFYYGDLVKGLSGGMVSVSIPVTLAGSSTARYGSFSGRYLDADGVSGPTGNLIIRFQPPVVGRPPMDLERTAIYAGWFSGFLIEDVGFMYDLEPSGVRLLDNFNFAHPALAASGRVLRVDVPTRYRGRYGGASGPGPEAYDELSGAMTVFGGFIGPGATVGTKLACYDQTTGSAATYGLEGICAVSSANSTCPTPLIWDGGGASANEVGPYTGTGTTFSNSVCTNQANEFVDHIVLQHQQLGDEGSRTFAFDGPFRISGGSSYSGLNAIPYGVGVKITWQNLPGVAAALTGLSVYLKPLSPSGGYHDDHMTQCHELPSRGYWPAGDVAIADQMYVIPGALSSQSYEIAVCPHLNGQHIGVVTSQYYAGPPVATKIAIVGPSNIYATACVPYELQALDDLNMIAQPSSSITVNLSGGSGSFYNDPGCGGPVSNINMDYPKRPIYYKNANAVNETLSTTSSLASQNLPITISTAVAPDEIFIAGPNVIMAHTCYQVTVHSRKGSTGLLSPVSTTTPVTLYPHTGSNFYTDWGCAATAGSVTLNTGQNNAQLFYKDTNGANSVLTNTMNASGFTTINYVINNSASPGAPVSLKIEGPNMVSPGNCESYVIKAVDASYNTALVSVRTVNLTASLGSFYSNASQCLSGSPITTLNFAAGDSAKIVYYKYATTASGVSLGAVDTNSPPLNSASMMIEVQTPP